MDEFELLLKLAPDQREEVVEFLKVWEEDFDAWKRTAEIIEELQKRYGEKRWYQRKVFRWLEKLKKWKLLIEKRTGRAKYYRPIPTIPGKVEALHKIIHIENILRSLKDLGIYSENLFRVFFLSEDLNTMHAFKPKSIEGNLSGFRNKWVLSPSVSPEFLALPIEPFWEYNTSLLIIGFPWVENLLPAEKIILKHITSKLYSYFKWLAWLRVKYLARELLGIQLPLEYDLKRVIREVLLEERYGGEIGQELQKLSIEEVADKIEKLFGIKIKIPKGEEDVNKWYLLRELRKKGHANDIAVILMPGPTKVALTDDGIGIDVESGTPLPPLTFPEKEESKNTYALLIRLPDKIKFILEKQYKFKPLISTDHEELELKIITDKSKIEDKLKKRGALALPEYELQDILDLEEQ